MFWHVRVFYSALTFMAHILISLLFLVGDLLKKFIYILFSDVKISGQVVAKIIHHLSESCICKNHDPPPTTCRGKYFIFYHAYFQVWKSY